MINAMLMNAELQLNLWGEVLLVACHIPNRFHSNRNKTFPYERLKSRKPNISYFKVWCCLVYCKNTYPKGIRSGYT